MSETRDVPGAAAASSENKGLPAAELIALVRDEAARRGLDVDRPARWLWDPWPQAQHTDATRVKAAGTNEPAPFLDAGRPVRLLEAHARWLHRSAEHRLLILPGASPGSLRRQWHPADSCAEAST